MNKQRKVMGKPRALTPIEEHAVYKMHKAKIPIAEIAYTYKISASTVYRISQRFKQAEEEKEND